MLTRHFVSHRNIMLTRHVVSHRNIMLTRHVVSPRNIMISKLLKRHSETNRMVPIYSRVPKGKNMLDNDDNDDDDDAVRNVAYITCHPTSFTRDFLKAFIVIPASPIARS